MSEGESVCTFLHWVGQSYEAHASMSDKDGSHEEADAYRGSAAMAFEHKERLAAKISESISFIDEAYSMTGDSEVQNTLDKLRACIESMNTIRLVTIKANAK